MQVILLIVGAALPYCWTHVALTYPPARNYALDFLDSARTKGPCGMPKGKLNVHFVTGSVASQDRLWSVIQSSVYNNLPVLALHNMCEQERVCQERFPTSFTHQTLQHRSPGSNDAIMSLYEDIIMISICLMRLPVQTNFYAFFEEFLFQSFELSTQEFTL